MPDLNAHWIQLAAGRTNWTRFAAHPVRYAMINRDDMLARQVGLWCEDGAVIEYETVRKRRPDSTDEVTEIDEIIARPKDHASEIRGRESGPYWTMFVVAIIAVAAAWRRTR